MPKNLIVSFRVTGLVAGIVVEKEFDLETTVEHPVLLADEIASEIQSKLIEPLDKLA